MNYLVSYPRSGNTAVRLFLERYTGRPTHGMVYPEEELLIDSDVNHIEVPNNLSYDMVTAYNSKHTKDYDRSLLYPYRSDFVVYKLHSFRSTENTDIDKLFMPKDKVVFLLRDYKDAIFSFVKYTGRNTKILDLIESDKITDKQYKVLEEKVQRCVSEYCLNIKNYNECRSQKIMVRYEDLLSDSYKEFSRVISFFDIKIYPERIKACDPINKEGKEEVDKWFIKGSNERINAMKKLIIPGMQFTGKYKKYFRKSTTNNMKDTVKETLGPLYDEYCKIYEEYEE